MGPLRKIAAVDNSDTVRVSGETEPHLTQARKSRLKSVGYRLHGLYCHWNT